MNSLFEWVSRIVTSWKFWIVIPPWDVGILVRLGKTASPLPPGFHFRIPFVDEITLVNTRTRIDGTPWVTIGSDRPGFARVVSATVGWRVFDPVKAALAYTNPGPIVLGLASAGIVGGLSPDLCLAHIKAETESNGVSVDFVFYSEDAQVRTLRILNGGFTIYSGSGGGGLDNEKRY